MGKTVLVILIGIIGIYSIGQYNYSREWDTVPTQVKVYCDMYTEPPFTVRDKMDCVLRIYKQKDDAFRNAVIGLGVVGVLSFIYFVKSVHSYNPNR